MVPTGAGGDGIEIEPAGALIDENRLRAHVRFLADDLLEGRGPGTRGGMLAAKYIASQFEAMGLEPAATDRTYFQQTEMLGIKTDPEIKLSFSSTDGAGAAGRYSWRYGGATAGARAPAGGIKTAELRLGDDFVASSDVEQKEIPVSSDVIFVGHGIQSPEYTWDDYKGIDVRGKIVMIMVNEPPATSIEPNLFGATALTYYGRWTYKFEEAARRGALGVILIHTNATAGYGWNVVRSSWSGERFGLVPDGSAPTLKFKSWITEGAARKLLQLAGQNFDHLEQASRNRDFRPVALNLKIDTTLKTTVRKVMSPNVVGIVRGSDPQLKQQVVVYSAHWDHLGVRPDQPGDNIYNGAVDNATGVAGILAIAQAYSSLQIKPKRSMLFIATTAEEQGLLGAEFYTRHPLEPINRTVANINLDSMNVLGLTTDITPLGSDRSTLGKVIADVAAENKLTVSTDTHPEQGSFYRSDHFPFARMGVPSVSLEPGSHFVGHSAKWAEDQFADYNDHRYHQPADEFSPNWDFRGMVQQARIAFWIGFKVANAAEQPQWNKGDEFEKARAKE